MDKKLKAKYFLIGKKIELTYVSNKRLRFEVKSTNTYEIVYDRAKDIWLCNCDNIKNVDCSHILAGKELYKIWNE